MTSRGKRKPRYRFDEIVIPRSCHGGRTCQPDSAAEDVYKRMIRNSPCRWHVKSAFDFEDVVVVEPTDFDNGAWWVRSIAPKLLLHLIGDRPIPVHVRSVDDDP